MSNLFLCVGDANLRIDSEGYAWKFSSGDLAQRFLVDGSLPSDVHIQVIRQDEISPPEAAEIFAAGRLEGPRPGWRLLADGQQRILQVEISTSPAIRQRLAIFDRSFSSGRVFVAVQPGAEAPYPYPLDYPLDRLLLINFLAQRRGGLFHACAVDDAGRGYLFVGPQEAGKSTLARLWAAHSGAAVLSDESVVVRKAGDQYVAYGTPWPGGAGAAHAGSVRLERIFFIGHGRRNEIGPIRSLDAVSGLIVESFPTFWDQECMEQMMDLCLALSRDVPCYTLHFLPTPEILDFVRGVS